MSDPRRFRLPDALVLIAGTALGLAAIRLASESTQYPNLTDDLTALPIRWSPYRISTYLACWLFLASPALLVGSLTLAVLTLYRPRPPLRRLLRQPGFLACLTTLVVAAAAAAREALGWWMDPTFDRDLNPLTFGLLHAASVGPVGVAILASWIALALSGRWRPVPSWLDRVGRLLGLVWIVFYFVSVSWFG